MPNAFETNNCDGSVLYLRGVVLCCNNKCAWLISVSKIVKIKWNLVPNVFETNDCAGNHVMYAL